MLTSAVTGTLWFVLSNVLTRGVGFAAQIILGWLLVPEDFGVWALAVSISTAVTALRNGGTNQILIKRGADYHTQAGPIFRFSLAFNLLAMLVLLVIAAVVQSEQRALAVVLAGTALSIPLGTPAMLLKAKLTIDGRFRDVATIAFGSSVVWQASIVVLAALGCGAFSFAAPALLQAIYESIASWRYTKELPPLTGQAHRSDYWTLFLESRWVMLGAAALALATTGGYFAIAMLSDARTTGLYFFAFQLIVAISAPLYGALESVLPSLFTRLDNDRPRQIDACIRTIRVMMGLGIPAAAILAWAAPPAIHFIWHGAWDAAAPAAQLLAACIPIWLLVSAVRSLIEARGLWRARFIVLGAYGVGGTLAAALGTLIFGTVEGIALTVVLFYIGFTIPVFWGLTRLGVPLLLLLTGTAAAAESSQPFVVFDGLLNADKPNLQRYGMPELRGTDHLWRPGVATDRVDERGVRKGVTFIATFGPNYYLDIENWPVTRASDEVLGDSLQKFIRVAQIARATAPDRKFGFYGVLPATTYWEVVLDERDKLAAWRRSNALARPLAQHVDFVFPSLYTFYEDREGWARAAREVLREARQYGKPVYPFLWPEYHDSTKLAGKPVPRDYWRMQLDLCREYADGVVIWGGYKKPWDPHAPWWLETQAFLKAL